MLSQLVCRDSSVLKQFANNDEQLKKWKDNIELAFNEKQKSSHILAKQIFYPIEQSYHLLSPVVSSSMAQVIHDRIWQTRKKDDPVRKAKKDKLFSDQEDVLFSKTAILKTTQSQHQNVSNLNGKRTRRLTLLSCQAPEWQNQLKPPVSIESIFNNALGCRTRDPLNKLRNLLLAIKLEKLSINLQRKKLIIDLISNITDTVFDYVAEIQNMEGYIGWTQETELPIHQQYWLDPYHKDEAFQTGRKEIDWQADILNDFARWINKQIYNKKLTLGVPHEKMWKKIISPLFREFNALTEASVKSIAEKEGK